MDLLGGHPFLVSTWAPAAGDKVLGLSTGLIDPPGSQHGGHLVSLHPCGGWGCWLNWDPGSRRAVARVPITRAGKQTSALPLPRLCPLATTSEAGLVILGGQPLLPDSGHSLSRQSPSLVRQGSEAPVRRVWLFFQNVSLQESGMFLNNLLWTDREFIEALPEPVYVSLNSFIDPLNFLCADLLWDLNSTRLSLALSLKGFPSVSVSQASATGQRL